MDVLRRKAKQMLVCRYCYCLVRNLFVKGDGDGNKIVEDPHIYLIHGRSGFACPNCGRKDCFREYEEKNKDEV